VVLGSYFQWILGSEYMLEELVRQADVEWGRVFCERLYFQQPGAPPHPDDPYTLDSVRETLTRLLKELSNNEA
jgi:hypothetical protein